MRLRVMVALIAMVAVPVATVACGGDGGGDGGGGGGGGAGSAVTSPTPDTFDYNTLTALVLRPEDVPADLPGLAGAFNTGTTNNGVSFTTWYGTTSLQLQSTVGRIADPIEREQAFDRIRRGIATLTENERNYDLAEADLAFIYKGSPPLTSILVFRGEFFVLVTQQSGDQTRATEAYDEEAIGTYTKIVFDRLLALIADPGSVTPIAGAARYATRTPGPATSTPAPTPSPED
jgi:hypothetical protein